MMLRRTLLGGMVAAPAILRHGVSRAASRRRIGLALPISGVQAQVADELLAGYQMAAQLGRTNGVDVELVIEDDKAQATNTAAAMKRFAADPSFLATSGIVGTPHALSAIPVARKGGLPVVGVRSGAKALRDGAAGVYHLRASYEDELDQIVGLQTATRSDVAIVYSGDAFGTSAVEYLKGVAARRNVPVVAAIRAERDGSNVQDMAFSATHRAVGASSLVLLMITTPAIAGIAEARRNGFASPIYTMSFTAGAQLATAGTNVSRGVGLVSAFPLPRSAPDELSDAFRRAAIAAKRADLVESVTAAEGFFYGTTIIRAIGRAGPQIARQSLVQALELPPGISVGGEQLAWDSSRVGRRYLQVCYYDAKGVLRA